MKSRIMTLWLRVFALLFVMSVANAQQAQPAQSNFSQPELEQMLAPIALYPDALLSQILMASTYPTEVAEASYWLKANSGLNGEAAVTAAQDQQWDISVKSLIPFPQVLSTMETKLDWTQNLGNAFLGQEKEVMDTVQRLRQKAMAAGYLKSDNRVRVVQEDQLISINLVQPTAVYVPYYNPTVVYGTWSAPAYAPVYWDPWPGYAVAPGHYGWAWAPVATVVTVGVLYGAFNWRHRHIYHHSHVSYWSRHHHYDHYRYRGSNTRWSHDYRHRRDVPYRHANVNTRFGHRAADYNRRVGPRPTTRDIRDGHYKPTRVSHTGGKSTRTGTNPYAGFKSGGTGRPTGGTTGLGTHGTRGVSGPAGTKGGSGHTGIRSDPAGFTKGTRGVSGPTGTKGRTHGTTGMTGKPSATGTTGRTHGTTGTTGRTGTTGTPGSKSISNRGSNPPGVAHGVRGTQPSASNKIRNTGNRTTTTGTPGARSGTTGNVGTRTGGTGKTASSHVRSNTAGTGNARRTTGNTGSAGRTGGGKPAGASPKPAHTPKPAAQHVKKKHGEK